MSARLRIGVAIAFCGLLASAVVLSVHARVIAAVQPAQSGQRNGVHDFDWDIGTWVVHQRRLLHPLSHSTTWVTYDGTDTVQKIWEGANMGKVKTHGSAGKLEIYTLRLYNPQTHQWSIYFTNRVTSTLSVPVVGRFQNGRGEFYDNETYNGKPIVVRFAVHDITGNTCRFDQSFSGDGGKTWEKNLIVDETLRKPHGKAPV